MSSDRPGMDIFDSLSSDLIFICCQGGATKGYLQRVSWLMQEIQFEGKTDCSYSSHYKQTCIDIYSSQKVSRLSNIESFFFFFPTAWSLNFFGQSRNLLSSSQITFLVTGTTLSRVLSTSCGFLLLPFSRKKLKLSIHFNNWHSL